MAEIKKKNTGIEIVSDENELEAGIAETSEEVAARIAKEGLVAVVPSEPTAPRTLRVYRETIGGHAYEFRYPGLRVKNDILLDAQAGSGRIDMNKLTEGYCRSVIVSPRMDIDKFDALSLDDQERILHICQQVFNGNFTFR